MFLENEFKALIIKKGKTLKEVAKALNINIATLYRKMSGESDFYRAEIQQCCKFLGEKDLNYIFLLNELRKRNKAKKRGRSMFQTIATIAISVIAPIFASCLGIASGKGDEEEKRKLLKLACAFLCGALIGGKPS